jgi:acetolactate synthase-1/3 small subunit
MKHTIAVQVENRSGVLSRVANLFSARGFNIDSLVVGETEAADVSRMTIVLRGDDKVIEQVTKQLNKLIDVIKVTDLSSESFIARDLALIRVNAPAAGRARLLEIVGIFRARIVDISSKSAIIEITGNENKIEAMIDMLRSFGIQELVRTGEVAIGRRGAGTLNIKKNGK